MSDSEARKRYCSASVLLFALMIGLPHVAIPQHSNNCSVPASATDEKFKPGQVWRIKGRTWEPDATATVLLVESLAKVGTIIHVRVDHVAMHTCPGNPVMDTIQHAPTAKEAFDRSVIELIRSEGTLPDYSTGYDDWRLHCGGVYTITVAEILAVNEKTARANWGCE